MKNLQPPKFANMKPLNLDKTQLSMNLCFSDRENLNRNRMSRNNKTPIKSKTMAQLEYCDEYNEPNSQAVRTSIQQIKSPKISQINTSILKSRRSGGRAKPSPFNQKCGVSPYRLNSQRYSGQFNTQKSSKQIEVYNRKAPSSKEEIKEKTPIT